MEEHLQRCDSLREQNETYLLLQSDHVVKKFETNPTTV